jgi:hypothetical protein
VVTRWDLIYELRSDEDAVRRVQEQNAKGRGFSTSPYLFGSTEWWDAIASGAVERRCVEGTITEAKPTSMPDRQEFRMLTQDGVELTGVRFGDPMRYVEGLRLRFEHITLRRGPEAPSELGTTADVVIAVCIEHSHKRTPYLHSAATFFPAPIFLGH